MRRAEPLRARRRQRGFTLLELMVGLVVGAAAIAGTQTLFGVLVDHSARIRQVSEESARRANGDHVLRTLLLSAEVGADPQATFEGSLHAIRFETWCLVPSGFSERCVAELLFVPDSSRAEVSEIRAKLSTGEEVTVAALGRPARFAYLEDAAFGGSWTASWESSVRGPQAVGIITLADTVVYRVGVAR